MECLTARERICGPSCMALIAPIVSEATSISRDRSLGRLDVAHGMDVSTGLTLHAIEISPQCNQPIKKYLEAAMGLFATMIKED